jgi:hypothetical protein
LTNSRYLIGAAILAFIIASIIVVWGTKDQASTCVISYNSALSDIPHMKKQIQRLEERVSELENQ